MNGTCTHTNQQKKHNKRMKTMKEKENRKLVLQAQTNKQTNTQSKREERQRCVVVVVGMNRSSKKDGESSFQLDLQATCRNSKMVAV